MIKLDDYRFPHPSDEEMKSAQFRLLYPEINNCIFGNPGSSGGSGGIGNHVKLILDDIYSLGNFNMDLLKLTISDSLRRMSICRIYDGKNYYDPIYPYSEKVDKIIKLLIPIIRDEKLKTILENNGKRKIFNCN